jgi:hypothetical protein
MKKMVFSAVAFASILALVACKGESTTGTGGGGSTTNSGGGTTGGGGAGGGGGGSGPTCASLLGDLSGWDATYASQNADAQALYDCVCGMGTPCSLVCNDPNNPSFCSGKAPVAGGMCETCIEQTAGANGCADQYNACMSN